MSPPIFNMHDSRRVRRRFGCGRFLLLVGAVFLCCVAVHAADEEGFQEFWKQHLATPDDHEAMFKACHEFAEAHAGDPLLPVVRGVEEWHRLRAGQKEEGLRMLVADLAVPAGPLNEGTRRIALGWMTRVDREQVVAALQGYYRKNVAYPPSLDKLPPAARPPMNDRFGKPWKYQLTGFAKVPGFTDQKYALQSVNLGDASEFKAALQLPYAARIQAVPLQVIVAPGNTQAVKFNLAGSAAVVGVGQSAGDLYLAFVGTRILIVCDYTHWKVLPRP